MVVQPVAQTQIRVFYTPPVVGKAQLLRASVLSCAWLIIGMKSPPADFVSDRGGTASLQGHVVRAGVWPKVV